MKRLAALLLVAAGLAQAAGDAPLGFSGPLDGGLPAGWRHVAFPSIEKTTSYAVVTSGNTLVLHAVADGSASFVVRRVEEAGERLRWRWRVDRTILAGDGSEKAKDDFAARVWVGFEGSWDDAGWSERRAAEKAKEAYGFTPPTEWVQYVWAGRGRARGEAFDEPYSPARFKCIALRSAQDELGVWYEEERDPRADFERLFGRKAPKIIAVAIMTDGDDTGSKAEAFYSDMELVSSASR